LVSSLLCARLPGATAAVWTGGGADANWSTGANWSAGVAPTNNGSVAIILAGTNQLAPNVDTAWSISSLTFSNNAGPFTLSGSALTIGAGGLANDSAVSQTLSNTIVTSAAQSLNAASNNLVFAGAITFASSNVLTVTGGSNVLISGPISGAGALTKTGTGTLTLTAANTYSGLTTVSAGVLNVENNSALSDTNAGTVVASGAALQLQGGIAIANEPLTLSGSGIGGSGALRNISGSNSWDGPITLAAASTFDADAGTLYLGGPIANAAYTATFTNVGAILLYGALGGGAGGLTKNGVGTLQLDAPNTYTGATTVNGGILQFGALGSLTNASAVTINSGATLDLNNVNEAIGALAGAGNVTLGAATLTVSNSAAATFSGVMSGTGALVKLGAGTLTLSGVNTFSGGATINAGAISVKADNDLGASGGPVTLNGGTLTASAAFNSARRITLGSNGGTLSLSGNVTLSNTISGPGALTKLGSKTLTLLGTNTYLGGTTNSAGTVSISSDAQLGDPGGVLTIGAATLSTSGSFTSARNVSLNTGTATFTIGTGVTNTLNGIISGPGALTKKGTGVLLLGGSNTYTNTTTVSAGTLRMGANNALSALTPVNITASSATLDLNSYNLTIGSLASSAAGKVTFGSGSLTAGGNNTSTKVSAVMSGSGSFMKTGTGTLTLSGNSTYTNTTSIAAGTLQISANQCIPSASPLVVSNGAVFNLTNFNATVASLSGAGSVTLGSGTLTAGNTSTTVFSGVISGTGGLVKIGAGTQTFSGTNTFSGTTSVNVGSLQVNGNSASSPVVIASAATLSGVGTVGAVTVNTGGTNAPGAAGPGTLTSGSQTWASGGNYLWALNGPTGTQGGNPGWAWMNISGALTINATAGARFVIKVVSLNLSNALGLVSGFNNTATYVWTIASASGGITGFSPSVFTIDTSAFQNPLGAGSFYLSQVGNNLNLIFTPASQPSVQGAQSGTLTSAGNGTNTVTINAINPSNSFLIFNTRHNSSLPGDSMVRGRITSSNSLQFVQVTTGTSPINIQWYVIQYTTGVSVQSGEVSQTNTVIDVPLAPLGALNQAFVTWSKTPDPSETGFSDSDPVVAQITSTTNLEFRVGGAPSSAPIISWQVIQFSNPASIYVQSGSVTNLTGTNTVATATLSAAVNTNSTFILTGYRTSGSGTAIGARMIRALLASPTTLSFDRSISGAPDNIAEIFWQAVQLNDGSVVQQGTVNFTNGLAETNVTLLPLDTNRAAAFASVQPVGGQNTGRSPSTGTTLGVGSATLALTSGTQLTLDRNGTADQCDVGWQVTGFGPSSLLAPATGGSAISADTTAGAYTSLTGPAYTELESGNTGVGTIILAAPPGFVFATNTPQPSVLITRVTGSGANSLNVNGVASGTAVAMTSVKTTNLVFTVTSPSSGGVTCSLTWQNLRVRPSAGTPLASGSLLDSGTATVQGFTTNATSWGFLAEVVGAASELAISTAPSSTAVAGVPLAQQPVIQIEDQFGNLRSGDDATVVTVTNTGTGVLQGITTATAAGGQATFSGLTYLVAETITMAFSAPGLTTAKSGNIVISPGPADQLAIQNQPSASATAGVAFPQQPVIQVQDEFGNLCGADNSTVITASLDQGSGTLLGTLTATDVHGVATFTNLNYQVAETITIDFTSGSLDPQTSQSIQVNPGAATQLVIQTQPSPAATAGTPFAQQPAIQILDQFGNLRTSDNSTVVTASRDAGSGSGVLQGTLTATSANGVAAFANLAHDVAGTISLDFNSGTLTGATSSSILILPGGAAALAFSTQPGSATVGSPFGVQPVVVTQDAYGNNSSSGLSSSLPVAMALSSGTGLLQGATNQNIGFAAGNGTVAFTGLRIDSAGSKQLTAQASGLASAKSTAFTVSPGPQTITFGPLSGVNYGAPPFSLNASASSGLPITFSIISGPATISGSNLTVTGAGTVTVAAAQPGGADYLAATSVNQSFVVTQAVLIVQADSKTRVFGATNPVLTASYSGFVNGDNSNALTGSPSLSTTATLASTVAGSPYPIAVTNGTLSASNYAFSFVEGQLAVTPAATTNVVSSSANPSPDGSNVTFTSTETPLAPGSGTPSGTVQFLVDGAPLGSPVALAGGVASTTTASLAHGTHVIGACYAGDGNFFGSTNNLNPNQSINTAPTAGNVSLWRGLTCGVKARITTFLANDSDPDGDILTFVSASPTSTAGGTVVVSNNWIFYTPPPGYTHSDSFSYVISDTGGLQATGSVSVAVTNDLGQSQNIVAVEDLGGGTSLIEFQGIVARNYTIQFTTNLTSPAWQSLGTASADASGGFEFTDAPATGSPARFYRSTDP